MKKLYIISIFKPRFYCCRTTRNHTTRTSNRMSILFLMKPLQHIQAEKDTSLLLMQAAEKLKHPIYYLPQGNITLTPNGAQFNCQKISCSYLRNSPIKKHNFTTLTEQDVKIIFIRTDPPFDIHYLNDMWMLEQLPKHIQCINNPIGIRTVNEKIWATQFKEIIPKTWVTNSTEILSTILQEHNPIIVKPTDGFGGKGIFKVTKEDSNKQVIFETLTNNGQSYVIAQEFIKESIDGDKRILLFDGEPISAVLRKQIGSDHRNNFFAGGKAYKTTLQLLINILLIHLNLHLSSLGLRFVGIDIIGDYLIEVNVTSPTGLQECTYFDNCKYEIEILNILKKTFQ